MDRKTLARVIADQVAANRSVADTIAASATMATSEAWYGKRRPDFYRTKAQETVASLVSVEKALTELIDFVSFYALLFPEAHDDDPGRDGYCRCGRWAETCPARAAAENGDTLWLAEDGTGYMLADPGPVPEAPPAEAPPAEPRAGD